MNDDAPKPPWHELLLLAIWLFATLGVRPLLLPDEGRYAGVAFEMLAGGALVPTLDGLPFLHKPPLLYWLDMGAMRLLGANPFAARVGPALLAWMLGAALFLHLRRWHDAALARIGLAVLATSPLFFIGAQYVNHDIGVAACITAAVLAFVRAVDEPGRIARRWLLAGWAFCALGVLAKGLIGVVLPLFIVVPWLLAQRRWRVLPGLLHPFGLAVFALVALPWLVAMQLRYPGFFDYFIVEQHFRRFAGTGFNNREPIWFFVVVLPLLMLPWSLWLWPALRQRGARALLYFWWIAAIVVFFSLPASKLVGYVLPALAPMAALLALALQQRVTRWSRVAALAALMCLGALLALAWRAPDSQRDIARVLGERWRAGDRLVFADHAFYDLRFYAGVATPAIVLSDWNDPDLSQRDNWRKELFDAARFTEDQGRSVLWPWRRLPELACLQGQGGPVGPGGRVWIVAAPGELARLAALPGLTTVLRGRNASLLNTDRGACAAAALQ